MTDKPTGVVFYAGPSRIDGAPIVAIATLKTANAKTGNLIQTWILRSDQHPLAAIHSGDDRAICGDCPLRGLVAQRDNTGETVNTDRACYVLVQQAPAQIYKSYIAGSYPQLSTEHAPQLAGRGLRYGSYGDPVAVPLRAWDKLAKMCTGKAEPGYTHQWRLKKFAAWRTRVMASTHTIAENEAATAAGWRTFRTLAPGQKLAPNEIHCPASIEGNFRATCEQCGACNGRRNMADARKSIAIVAHGQHGKIAIVSRLIAARS
jgi:hypothetical protein